jgi:hypothetical protein
MASSYWLAPEPVHVNVGVVDLISSPVSLLLPGPWGITAAGSGVLSVKYIAALHALQPALLYARIYQQ